MVQAPGHSSPICLPLPPGLCTGHSLCLERRSALLWLANLIPQDALGITSFREPHIQCLLPSRPTGIGKPLLGSLTHSSSHTILVPCLPPLTTDSTDLRRDADMPILLSLCPAECLTRRGHSVSFLNECVGYNSENKKCYKSQSIEPTQLCVLKHSCLLLSPSLSCPNSHQDR